MGLSRTVLGRVAERGPDYLTILLERGNYITVLIKYTSLKLGNRCLVCINNSTNKVVKVMDYDEDFSIKEISNISTNEDNLSSEIGSRGVLGSQRDENLEFGV